MTRKKHVLTVFSLTMITIGSVDSIRNLPTTALLGGQLISFFIIGALFFLIPAALVSAELASTIPGEGGVYLWVKQAFGKKVGFLAIWLQWISNVIWYPTLLSFVAGTIGYLISPSLINNSYYLWLIIVASFWIATLINLCGMHASSWLSNLCAISGLLLPMSLIIGLGIIWMLGDNLIQISFDTKSILPHWGNDSMISALTAIILSFCGIEIATIHTNEVNNPQHAFPRALIYSVVIILATLILGSLSIAVVLPQQDINLVAGIMQAFDAFFSRYNLRVLMPLIALMLVMGGFGSVSNWIIAPTKGLLIAAKDGHLPSFFYRTNRQDAPVVMLLAQAFIVTLLSSLFVFMPSVNGSYWFLTVLAAQLYMLMYFLMFIAIIRLRLKSNIKQVAFRIPGGITGMLVVSLVGVIGVLTTFIIGFISPPSDINVGQSSHFEIALLVSLFVMCLPPLINCFIKRSS